MGEIKQATFTTDELEIYIDRVDTDLMNYDGKYTVEVYSEKDTRKLLSRNIFENYERAFNYVFEEVL